MSRDNASQRCLQARKRPTGHEDSLTNTYGTTLPDGAQCFVLESEANFRFLKHSVLHADGEFVVEPIDGIGRWVREQGLVGFATLLHGQLGPEAVFAKYDQAQLVQFAVSLDGRVMYTGHTPRAAFLSGRISRPAVALGLVIDGADGRQTVITGSPEGVQGAAMLMPGDRVSLHTSSLSEQEFTGDLFVVLQ